MLPESSLILFRRSFSCGLASILQGIIRVRVMRPDEAAKLARVARKQAMIASTPAVRAVLFELADKYEAIASSACDVPQSKRGQ
jgi:hypothetical protein